MGSERGFTIVELIVTVPIFIISIGILVGFLVTLYIGLLIKDAESRLALDAQLALNAVQDDVYFARNFAERPSDAMVDADAPGGNAQNWTYNGTPPRLIVYEIALDAPRQDPNRQVVYQNTAASGNSCAPEDIDLNPPVLNNLIYYVEDGTLKRRALVPDPVHARCSDPYRQQTCTTNTTRQMQTSGGPQTVPCPADSVLASNVEDFAIAYYDADNNLIDTGSGGSPLQAERVTLTLTLAQTIAAEDVEHTSQLTITKINSGDPNIQ